MKTTEVIKLLNDTLFPIAYIGIYQAPEYFIQGINNIVIGKLELSVIDNGLDQIDSQDYLVNLYLYCNDKIKCQKGIEKPLSQLEQERYLDGCRKALWDIGLNPSIIVQDKTPSTQTTLVLEFNINIQGDN